MTSRLARGTPATLVDAIANALEDCQPVLGSVGAIGQAEVIAIVKLHVTDYLAQKFNTAMLTHDAATAAELEDLWQRITSPSRPVSG